MQNDRKRKPFNWSSAIGWIIFILIVAGQPLFRLFRGLLGGAGVTIPLNIVPIAIGMLVVLSIVVAVVRALGNASRASGEARLPTTLDPPVRAPGAPMPPFGGTTRIPPSRSAPSPLSLPGTGAPPQVPSAPRFEPVISPAILGLGILGLIVLGGAALVIFGLNAP